MIRQREVRLGPLVLRRFFAKSEAGCAYKADDYKKKGLSSKIAIMAHNGLSERSFKRFSRYAILLHILTQSFLSEIKAKKCF